MSQEEYIKKYKYSTKYNCRIRNEELYSKLPKVTHKIRERRLGLACHCIRHSEQEVCHLMLWEPSQGRSSRGSPWLTDVEQLKRDTRLKISEELASLTKDRCRWQAMT